MTASLQVVRHPLFSDGSVWLLHLNGVNAWVMQRPWHSRKLQPETVGRICRKAARNEWRHVDDAASWIERRCQRLLDLRAQRRRQAAERDYWDAWLAN